MMVLIRSLIFYGVFIFLVPITACLIWLFPVKGNVSRYTLMRWFGVFTNFCLKWICGVRFKSNLHTCETPVQPSLIIANHTGPWETLALAPFLGVDYVYVVKKVLVSWKYSFFAMGVRALGCIAISREKNAGDFKYIIDCSRHHFQSGRHVLIFPEGSRYPVEHCLTMDASAFLMAKKLKCPVLPVFINSEAWSLGKFIKDFGLIHPGTIEIDTCGFIPAEVIQSKSTKELHHELISYYQSKLEPS